MKPWMMIVPVLLSAMTALGSRESEGTMKESERLHALLAKEWEWRLREYPTLATYVGDRRYDDRLPDLSRTAIERRRGERRGFLEELLRIDRAILPAADQLNYDLFRRDLESEIEGYRFPSEVMAINQMGGVHQELAELAIIAPKAKPADYRNLLARLRAYPRLVDQTIALLREGLEKGVTPPRVPLRGVTEAIAAQIPEAPEKSPIWGIAFESMPASIPESEREELRQAARTALRDEVFPALRRLQKFWNGEYYPRTRETIGLSSVPDGAAWYAYNVREMTTTDLAPERIHEIGVAEVARIRDEMESIREQVGFEGPLEEFFEHLRTDPRFFFETEEMLLMTYRDIAKRIDPELPRLFGTLPRLPYGVLPVPEYSEKTQTTAYYMPGSPEVGRPGYFYANTYDLKSRPKWEMEALTVHEAVPGHHLQISLAQELEGVPEFRRWGGYTAFVEGWGLYSESLGRELGLYEDPYSRFGQLTYEMWRAVRLVVDTGMHVKGWTRQQAIDFFKANSSKAEHDIAVEIDRYLVWPGQALAYKIGQLRIRELRSLAETELGEGFDIRQFHDAVLLAGPLPLAVLEERVRAWIADQKKAARAS
ncbi:MAG TPA: DUF885 domain-containing protein [Thermoanaerobaculia bacterium]|nr:DUF885 domain-containing protein [Thermoanaerobaculia bacterium]